MADIQREFGVVVPGHMGVNLLLQVLEIGGDIDYSGKTTRS